MLAICCLICKASSTAKYQLYVRCSIEPEAIAANNRNTSFPHGAGSSLVETVNEQGKQLSMQQIRMGAYEEEKVK